MSASGLDNPRVGLMNGSREIQKLADNGQNVFRVTISVEGRYVAAGAEYVEIWRRGGE